MYVLHVVESFKVIIISCRIYGLTKVRYLSVLLAYDLRESIDYVHDSEDRFRDVKIQSASLRRLEQSRL